MKKLLLTSLLAFGGMAGATATPFLSVFSDGQRDDVYDTEQYAFLYTTIGSKPTRISVTGFSPSTRKNTGVLISRVDMDFEQPTITPANRALARELVWRVASKCMNIDPKRKAAILGWVDQQYAHPKAKVLSQFGPLTVRFERQAGPSGGYVSTIGLGRSQTPGVAPWVNYCVFTD